MKQVPVYLMAFLAISISFYPLMYLLAGNQAIGLLQSKSPELLQDQLWSWAFYQHIIFGGLSLLSGWSQFLKGFRNRHLNWHRGLGKVYLVAVLLSGSAGFYLAFFASTGLVAGLGFGCLAVFWLGFSAAAYRSILQGKVNIHRDWMIRSFALTFAAVTLRFWMPLFLGVFALPFNTAYPIIAWLAWVPNLLVAEWIVRRNRT